MTKKEKKKLGERKWEKKIIRCGVKGCSRPADNIFYFFTRLLRCSHHQKNTATLK